VQALRRIELDVDWVAEWERDPGDEAILNHAHASGRVLLTRDKDFGELIFRDSLPHAGVLRLAGEMNYADQARIALQVLKTHRLDLERAGVVTAEAGGRVRVSAGKSVH